MVWVVVFLGCLWALCQPVTAAVDCDGSGDYLLGPQLSEFYTTTAKTLIIWYTATGTPPAEASCNTAAVQSIVATTGGVSRLIVTRSSATRLCVGHYDTGLDQLNFTTYTDGSLVMLTFVHGPSSAMLWYKDGAEVASGTTGASSTLALVMAICGNTGVFASAQGRIHHVMTSNQSMPAAEIAILASSKRPRLRRTPATGSWLFDNCTDGVTADELQVRDHSGNSREFTGESGGSGLTCRASTVFSFGGGIQ